MFIVVICPHNMIYINSFNNTNQYGINGELLFMLGLDLKIFAVVSSFLPVLSKIGITIDKSRLILRSLQIASDCS